MGNSLAGPAILRTDLSYARLARQGTTWSELKLASFLGFHVLLAIILQASSTAAVFVGTLHCLVTCVVAVWATTRWKAVGIACVAAYTAGAEVLWRMTGAHTPWEIGKYLIVALCIGGILRMGHRAKWNWLAVVYFMALLPSIAVLIQSDGHPESLLQSLSFNLSGPLCLFASAWYMSQLRLSRRDVQMLLVSLIAPLLTIAAVTLLATHSAVDLSFTDESSLATSGGFGPNQVSVVLGLGALASLMLAVDPIVKLWHRSVAFGLVLFFGAQCVMTFSRGGLYSFLVAFLLAAVWFLRNRAVRMRLIGVTAAATLITIAVIFPRLEEFTGGALADRFADTDPGHRKDIAMEDIRLWGEHPILGLGPGGARSQRRGEFRIAHTEYTRLLSEHGLFGVLALAALVGLGLTQLLRHQPAQEKALRIAFMTWSLTSMLHLGMRVAAIGLIFGWSCSRILLASESRSASTTGPPA